MRHKAQQQRAVERENSAADAEREASKIDEQLRSGSLLQQLLATRDALEAQLAATTGGA